MGFGQKNHGKGRQEYLLFVSLFEETALNALSAITCLMGRVLRQSQKSITPAGERIPGKASTELYRGNLMGSCASPGWVSQDM